MTTRGPADADSFVAVGDSFTEGLADDLGPDGRHRGWADRVATALAARNGRVRYANLAVRGRLLDAVVGEQVPAALALAPSLISFQAGLNDVLRPGVDLTGLLARYRQAVATLRAGGADVVLFTAVERTGGTGRMADRLAARFNAFSVNARATAAEHGCLLVDVTTAPALGDRRSWHEDRLHLTPTGHARVAAAVLEALGVDDPRLLAGAAGWWREPLPAPPPRTAAGRAADLAADARWVRRHLVPWAVRRLRGVSSGDLVRPKHEGLVEVVRPPVPGGE